MQITSQGAVAMLEYLNHVVILPVCGSWRSVKVKCLLMSERLSCSCNGFEEPVNKKPEYTLPADLPIAIWSEFVDYYQIYSASREDGPFFSGQYLRVQNSTKCHFNDLFNRPEKTRRLSVKGMLAFFCHSLNSGLFQFMGDWTTHPILSMLLTHTTSGLPVITIQRAHPAWPAENKVRTVCTCLPDEKKISNKK